MRSQVLMIARHAWGTLVCTPLAFTGSDDRQARVGHVGVHTSCVHRPGGVNDANAVFGHNGVFHIMHQCDGGKQSQHTVVLYISKVYSFRMMHLECISAFASAYTSSCISALSVPTHHHTSVPCQCLCVPHSLSRVDFAKTRHHAVYRQDKAPCCVPPLFGVRAQQL